MTSHPPSYTWPCWHLYKGKLGEESKLWSRQEQGSTAWGFYQALSQPPIISSWETSWTKDGFSLLNQCSSSPLHKLVQPASEPRSAFRIHNIPWQRAPQVITQWEELPPLACFEPALSEPRSFYLVPGNKRDSWAPSHSCSIAASLPWPLLAQTTVTSSFLLPFQR